MKIKEIEKRIHKLNSLEKSLENFNGHSISITRLTVIKYLCKDYLAMLEFSYFIANKVKTNIKYSEDNASLKTYIEYSIKLMEKVLTDFLQTKILNLENASLIKLDELKCLL